MRISKRWVPAAVVASVITAGVVAIPLQASAVDLPDLTPQQVMLLMDGEVKGFSGTVVKTTELGLPPLEMSSMMSKEMITEMEEKLPKGFEDFVPSLIEQNAITQAVELIAGTHRARIYASESGLRVQILDRMSQRDLVVNQDEFWYYDARKATALTGAFDFEISDADKAELEASAEEKLAEYLAKLPFDAYDPEAVADYLMAQAGESTEITVGKDHLVAGRTAYQLIAQPRSVNSLIQSIVISVDSETGMALDVKVYSTEQEAPALSIGFESISFETPDASLFSFTPPAGTTVERLELPSDLEGSFSELREKFEAEAPSEAELEALRAELEEKYGDMPRPELIGEGWESVVYLAEMPEDVPMELLENELFADLMTQVPGGKVFSTPVLNVLVTDSGAVYAGAVSIEFLQQVAAR